MKHTLLLLWIFTSSAFSQEVIINEIQAKNINTYKDPDSNKYTDWIELKNTSSLPVDIGGYFLSDDIDEPDKWAFPIGTAIPGNDFLLVFADGENSGLHTNFKLSSSGETIILSGTDKVEVHKIEYPVIQNDISYGRLSDASYSFLSNPTPTIENIDSSAFTYIDAGIAISVPSGVYASTQIVTITSTGEDQIYYTTDGTTPNASSMRYNSPITIDKNTPLKVIVIKSPSEYSIIEYRSYIIGATHELPVILLTADNHLSNKFIDGRVEFNFIETDGTTVINQYANFEGSGNSSKYKPQLNGRVEADNIYGDGDFDHKMYPNKNINKFKRFLLRNASQDWSETHIRDAFISRLLSEDNLADFPFEGYRPAVLYVNSIYQGIINVREDDDNAYIRHNFELKEGEFSINERDLIRYDFTTDREVLEKRLNFNDHVNVHFLKKYSALNEYGFGSWKDLTDKTKHENHYFMHDFDAIFGLRGEDHVPLIGPMRVSSLVPSEMVLHIPYKNEALQFIATIINHIYNRERSVGILDAMERELESEIPAHAVINSQLAIDHGYNDFNKPPFANLAEWKENIDALRTDIEGRLDTAIFTRIKNEYSLEAPIQVTYESSDINKGFVRVHGVKSIKEIFTGTYFSNIPLKLSTEALPGYRFVRWEGDVTGTAIEIAPVFSKNASVTAIFEPIITATTDVVINEVQGKNDTTIADENGEFDDWIEIYNPTDIPVNVAGYYISDKPTEPLKWRIPDTDASKTMVEAKGYLLLWADKDLSQGENHLGFSLKGTDEVLLTAPDATTLLQQVSFTDIDTDTSYGAKVDADSEYIVFSVPTPGTSNGVTLSTDDFELINKNISVYPNPTIDLMTITNLPGDVNQLTWKLYNIAGKIIKSGTQKEINLEEISEGIYILNINDIANIKVIKQ